MAWNRPSNQIEEKQDRSTHRKNRAFCILSIIGFLSAFLAGIYFCRSGEGFGEEKTTKKKHTRNVETRQHATAYHNEGMKDEKNSVLQDNSDSNKKIEGKQAVDVSSQINTNCYRVTKSKYSVFEHESESLIAYLINQPIGELVIGAYDFDEAFKRDLQQALINKIIIDPNDSEETKLIKQSVVDVKKHLSEQLRNGVDIIQLLSETRNELQTLGQYKEELACQIDELQQKEEITDQDVEDFVEAANIMLDNKGIDPLYFSKTSRIVLRSKPKIEEEPPNETYD